MFFLVFLLFEIFVSGQTICLFYYHLMCIVLISISNPAPLTLTGSFPFQHASGFKKKKSIYTTVKLFYFQLWEIDVEMTNRQMAFLCFLFLSFMLLIGETTNHSFVLLDFCSLDSCNICKSCALCVRRKNTSCSGDYMS